MEDVYNALDILNILDKFHTKGSLTKNEYDYFDNIRDRLIEDYYDKNSKNKYLLEHLKSLDFTRILFLCGDMELDNDSNERTRKLIFELIYQNKEKVRGDNGALTMVNNN